MFLPSVPNDLRIVLVLTILLAAAAFAMGVFAVWLFYRFYRDAIRPGPRLILEVSEATILLRLVNQGNNPFTVSHFMVAKAGRSAGSVATFLPLINDGTGYISWPPVVEGRKLNPGQEIRLFEFNLSLQGAEITLHDIRNIIEHLNGLSFEILCQDLSGRYRNSVRKKIYIDPENTQPPDAT